MATLYETTSLIKTILKWGSIAIGGIIVLILLYRGGRWLATVIFPKKPDPPKVAFGKLPIVIFPDNISQTPFTYSIDTVSGTLGSFPDRATVYKTDSPVPNLLNLQNARASLTSTPFIGAENKVTDTEYSWQDIKRDDKSLTMNIVSKDFTINGNYLTYPDLTPTVQINPEAAVTMVTKFLQDIGVYPLDFDETKTTTQLLNLNNTSLVAATSVSDAELIRVDLFQKDLEKMPIMYDHPPFSSTHFLLGGANTNEILEGSFTHQGISDESSTYSMRSGNYSFNSRKQNKAYIASYYGNREDISIKNIYLAYYMSSQKQNYVMPIYVFEGKDGFYAYVSAVSDTWVH